MSQISFESFANIRSLDSSSSSNSTARAPDNFHGALGQWAVVGYGINICSVICSSLVILSTLVVVWKWRNLLSRPSLRISTAIAVCDIIYSVCQMFIFNNTYMSNLTEIHLRAFLWLMAGSTVTFIFLSVCMGIQLVLMVLANQRLMAERVQPWYEVVSFLTGFLITHPYMYLFKSVRWVPTAQMFYLEDEISVSKRNVWLIHWTWVFVGIVFLFCVAIAVYLQMARVWRAKAEFQRPPEHLDKLRSRDGRYTDAERRHIRSVTTRVTLYPMIPVITQTMVVTCNLLPRPPFWLFVMANIMPTLQGTFNFLVYIMNPALDVFRKALVDLFLCRSYVPDKIELSDSMQHLPSTLRGPGSLYSLPKDDHVLA